MDSVSHLQSCTCTLLTTKLSSSQTFEFVCVWVWVWVVTYNLCELLSIALIQGDCCGTVVECVMVVRGDGKVFALSELMKGERKRQICDIILKTTILLFNSKCPTYQHQLRGKACWQFIRSGKTKTYSLKGWRIKISKHFNRLGKPRWKQHTCIWTHILTKDEESRGGIFTRLGKPHWKQAHTWCKNPWSRVRNHRAEEEKGQALVVAPSAQKETTLWAWNCMCLSELDPSQVILHILKTLLQHQADCLTSLMWKRLDCFWLEWDCQLNHL